MDYSNIDVVLVYSGEAFKDIELDSIKRLFDVFNDASEVIDAGKLEGIVRNAGVIKRFLNQGILVKDGQNYRLKEDKVQDLIEETLGPEPDYVLS